MGFLDVPFTNADERAIPQKTLIRAGEGGAKGEGERGAGRAGEGGAEGAGEGGDKGAWEGGAGGAVKEVLKEQGKEVL